LDRARATRNVAIFGLYLVVAVGFAMPVDPTRWNDVLPGDNGDALLNLWILGWVGDHLGSGWSDLWDTSIFWPNENTLAYSESLIPVAVAHRALSAVVGSEVLAFNLIHVVAWSLSGWITYLLARRLSGSTGAALVAGLAYTVATPRLAHYGHFQLSMGFLVPLALLLLLRFFERPGPARGGVVGFTVGILVLSTSYYGVMVLVALAVLVPGLVIWTWRTGDRTRILAGLGVAALVGAAIVVPVAWQYHDLQQDAHFRRDPDPRGNAQVADFIRVMPGNYVLADLPPFESSSRPESANIERRLYPGVPALLLAVVGFGAVIAHRRRLLSERPIATRVLVLLVPAALALLVLAFGDELVVRGRSIWMPYSQLHDVPGFSGIRATARFVAFPLLVVALFAAVGLGAILGRVRHRGARIAIVVGMLVLVGAESMTKINFAEVPSDAASEAVNRALGEREPAPVLELPVGSPIDGALWSYIETPRQYLATIDGNPRVSGYSGFAPPGFDATAGVLESFPSDEAFDLLASLGVRYVVLRTMLPEGLEGVEASLTARDGVGLYSEARAREIVDHLPSDRVARADRHGSAWLIELSEPRSLH
jgi:hypothetical protein